MIPIPVQLSTLHAYFASVAYHWWLSMAYSHCSSSSSSSRSSTSSIWCVTDALHAYFGVCGLSLMTEHGLQPMHAALSVSQRAANHLATIHNAWSLQRRSPRPEFCHNKHVSFLRSRVAALLEQTMNTDCCRFVLTVYYQSNVTL